MKEFYKHNFGRGISKTEPMLSGGQIRRQRVLLLGCWTETKTQLLESLILVQCGGDVVDNEVGWEKEWNFI